MNNHNTLENRGAFQATFRRVPFGPEFWLHRVVQAFSRSWVYIWSKGGQKHFNLQLQISDWPTDVNSSKRSYLIKSSFDDDDDDAGDDGDNDADESHNDGSLGQGIT